MTGDDYKSGYLRVSWTALLVLVLGIAASTVMWYAIKSHELKEVSWATKLAADAIKIDLTTDVQWQLFGLDRLALLWETTDPEKPLWKKNAELYIQHRPGALAVAWISADTKKRSVVYAKGHQDSPLAYGGIPTHLMESAAEAKVAIFSGTIAVPGGNKQWAIAYPVFARGQLQGFVISFFDFDQSLGYIVEDLGPLDFSFEVSQGEQHLYLKPGASRKHMEEWATTAEIDLPGGKWQVRVWPNPSVVDRIKSRLSELALVGGIFLSFLVAVIVHLMVNASSISKRIALINQELKREVGSRRQAQEELTRAHEQLELRVQERTFELAQTNALLGKEIEGHQRAEESLRELNARLFHLQDEERRRLARELHDGATQGLVALALNIETFRQMATESDDVKTVDECAMLIQQCTTELRTISYLLHPPLFDELGLGPALHSYVEGFAKRSGIQVNLEISPQLGRLGHETELTIFRVVQEALSNVHHHSRSRTAGVLLCRNTGDIRLEIVDYGRGIAPELLQDVRKGVAGIGTAGMRERVRLLGGQIEIASSGTGTRIEALIPISQPASDKVIAHVASRA